MKTVAIIFGGNSSEYEVSLKSAFSIIETLEDYETGRTRTNCI